jgi:hypothetical protein
VLHLDGDGCCGLGPEIPLFCAARAMAIGKSVTIPALADALLVSFLVILQKVLLETQKLSAVGFVLGSSGPISDNLTILNSAHMLSSWVILCPVH